MVRTDSYNGVEVASEFKVNPELSINTGSVKSHTLYLHDLYVKRWMGQVLADKAECLNEFGL
jgi:hypothetical protein